MACLDSERQALLEFKHGLIDEAHRLALWVVDDKDCCRWDGIACDNSTGHVHRIHLRGPNFLNIAYITDRFEEAEKKWLRGNKSRSLLGLKQLKHLALSSNDFAGIQVTKFIGSLQNLRYLNLSNSFFSGIIPPQLGNLSKLHVLCLGIRPQYGASFEQTSMVNMHWLSSLRLLQYLDLSGVDLSKANDHWLHVINNLHSLVELHVSACSLTKTRLYVHQLNLTSLSLLDLYLNFFETSVPQWLFSITSLVSLDISWNFYGNIISSSIHSFRNLISLEFLHVSDNDFKNSSLVLTELSGSNLIMLDISYCRISNLLLNSLHNLTNLLNLDLSGNQLTKRIPNILGNLCNLRDINLSYNNFSNISLAYLLESFLECKSPALESLSLSKNNIVGIIPHSIGELSFLRELDLAYNQLNGSIPCSLGQLTKLAHLDFSDNLLTGIVTEAHFAKLVNMKYLHGARNNLTLRLHVANWIPPFQLQKLFINSWVLGPQFPSWLQSQKHLMYLDISNTKISSPMPESFVRSFPNLIYLNISHNQIHGKST
ncbi:hypothetical protein R6Q59_019944 [Mikania micrantha]